MSLKFESSDFYSQNAIQAFIGSPTNGKTILCSDASKKAQDIFDKWLSEQPLVHCCKDVHGWAANSNIRPPHTTHTARLVDIQPIEKNKCEHEVESLYIAHNNKAVPDFYGTKCLKCGKTVQAKFVEIEA